MSFQYYHEKIRETDTVILYVSNNLYAIDVHPQRKNKKGELVENVYQTSFGALRVRNLIGAQFGSRVELSQGWGHVLQPTPELWSLTLPHRTQIIYTPDISMILFALDIVPGCAVIEAGTGSGSLSHAIIRRIRPHGHLYSFEFHEFRARVANEEFTEHGLSDFVSCQHRDVVQDGFSDDLDGKADAVFLDLPRPWDCIPYAVKAIKEDGGRFCSFSPCIEQVMRTRTALCESGFVNVHHLEVLQFELKVSKRVLPIRDLSFLKHRGSSNPVAEKPDDEKNYVVGAWPTSAPGHTGYVTVGVLPPTFRRKRRKLAVEDSENAAKLEDAAKPDKAAKPENAAEPENAVAPAESKCVLDQKQRQLIQN